MTRKEAIKHLRNDWFMSLGGQLCVDEDKKDAFLEAIGMGIKALHPVSRERVERMRGEWIIEDAGNGDRRKKCSLCNQPISGWWGRDMFCANCGAPMTDEAVEMVMERINKMEETGNGLG